MKLSDITSGKLDRPFRILIYGTEGVGKSTLAAGAPNPVFICPEDGTSQLDIARFPEPRSWDDVLTAVKELHGDHDYKTLVIDTLDWLEPICWKHVCIEGKKKNIEAFGFGKGYAAALATWRELLADLDKLRSKKRMNVIAVAHSMIRTFKNPEGEDFDRYELKLNVKASGLWKEWSDAVLYTTYETYVDTEGNRGKGISSGRRIMHSERRAAFDAKNRYSLPETLPLQWSELEAAMQARQPITAGEALKQIEELCATLDESSRKKAADLVKKANGDTAKLYQLIEWMKGKK